jgi:hypothetical protein
MGEVKTTTIVGDDGWVANRIAGLNPAARRLSSSSGPTSSSVLRSTSGARSLCACTVSGLDGRRRGLRAPGSASGWLDEHGMREAAMFSRLAFRLRARPLPPKA